MGKNDFQYDYENIFDNPDSEDEKYFAENSRPICALRLYNFMTDFAQIIENHKTGIYKYIFIPMRSQTNYWINLVGYASKKGDRGHNFDLSLRRCFEVQREIMSGKNKLYVAEFRKTVARGADASPDAYDDDFGYWRSVKIYVHKGSPQPPKVEPKPAVLPPFIEQKFAIRLLGGNSKSLVKYLGRDNYTFRIKNLDTNETACFFYHGTSIGVGGPGTPVSFSGSGPWAYFKASSRFKLSLESFDKIIVSLLQEPGVSLGSISQFGNFHLDFRRLDNKQFTERETSIDPPTIKISSDRGVGLSMGITSSSGPLEKIDCPDDADETSRA